MTSRILFFLALACWNLPTAMAQSDQKRTMLEYMLEQVIKLQRYWEDARLGNQIIHDGLTFIGDIKSGDLNMHATYFASLKKVSPTVRKYANIATTITLQIKMLSDYKVYLRQFTSAGVLSAAELDYLTRIFASLQDVILKDADELAVLLTDGDLQMKDDERLKRMDKITAQTSEQYNFLHGYGDRVLININQRQHELKDVQTLQKSYQP